MRLLNLILSALLTLSWHLLRRCRALRLLLLQWLLSLSFTLLALQLSLILSPRRLRHRLALGLNACAGQRSGCRIKLPPQFLHLLTGVAVSVRCLPGEISYLPFASLLSADVRLLSCRPRSSRALVRDLQVLSSRLSCDRLNT